MNFVDYPIIIRPDLYTFLFFSFLRPCGRGLILRPSIALFIREGLISLTLLWEASFLLEKRDEFIVLFIGNNRLTKYLLNADYF